MLAVGYSQGYSDNGLGQGMVFGNIRVIEAIKAIDGVTAAKQGRTVTQLDKMYQEAYDLAKSAANPNTNSMNGSITGIARLYGMDKDATDDKQVLEIEESYRLELKRVARVMNSTS